VRTKCLGVEGTGRSHASVALTAPDVLGHYRRAWSALTAPVDRGILTYVGIIGGVRSRMNSSEPLNKTSPHEFYRGPILRLRVAGVKMRPERQ
jgi:hypothetical protein